MKYIVYLTTNSKSLIDGKNKIYIGVHKTKDPNIFDGYIGCGVYKQYPNTYKNPKTPFQYAVKKYGPDAFTREILYVFDTEKEAYLKEEELVDVYFIKQSHVYNVTVGGICCKNNRALYQFDLKGNLLKKWDYSEELYNFYGYSIERFNYAVYGKHPLMDCYWSNVDHIDITEYLTKPDKGFKITYLYSKSGKCLGEFPSRKKCAEFINVKLETLVSALKRLSLINKEYYVSDKLFDEFVPKARKQYQNETFYLYQEEPFEFIGTFVGKEIMKATGNYSWTNIRDHIRHSGWYKEFYISLKEITELPERRICNGFRIDVYTKYGEFIETLNSVRQVKEKYKIHASKIKNIQLGDRYVDNYIFKYHKISK